MHEKQILMYLLDQLASRPVFPKIYDGFREIVELSKGEDALLRIMQDCVRLIADDKLIGLANETKLAEWEAELGLSGQGLTLDERRAQMTDYLGRSRIINDAALLTLARNAAGNDDIEITTDCDRLTCSIHKSNTEDAEEAEELRRALVAVRPAMPQNLSLSAGVRSEITHTFTANHAQLSALHSHLGLVTEIGPLPPVPGLEYGVMTQSEDINTEVIEQGLMGEPRLAIKGSLIDSGVPPYGVISNIIEYVGFLSNTQIDVVLGPDKTTPWTYWANGSYQELGQEYKTLYDNYPSAYQIIAASNANGDPVSIDGLYFYSMDNSGNFQIGSSIEKTVSNITYTVDITNL